MNFLNIDFPWQSIITILSFSASIVALYVAWKAYKLQQKSDKDLNRMENNINRTENNIQKIDSNIIRMENDIQKIDSKTSQKLKEISSIEKNIHKETQNIKQISKQTQSNVNKAFFLIERTSAFNKYPESEKFKKINEAYLNFIFPLFDMEYVNIGIDVKINFSLEYKIKLIKDKIGVPFKTKNIFFNFYIIQIISPSENIAEKNLKKYERSPIKEGEYYACRFDEGKCSWFLGEQLSLGTKYEDCYRFYVSSFSEGITRTPTANEIMREIIT